MKNSISLTILLLISLTCFHIQAQYGNSLKYDCVFDEQGLQTSFIGGNLKTERTDLYQGTNDESVFPVIVVFVKFLSGEPYPNDPNWPLPPYGTGDPVFLDNIIATDRNNNFGIEWWNAYDEEEYRLSDFWMEAS